MTVLPDTRREPERDRWGRPLIAPPDGGKPVAYTRVTTVAKTLDGGDALIPWKASLAISGLLARPGLRSQWEALAARTAGNPWYHDAKAKGECKRLVDECASAGGADDRAQMGTALHAMAELVDRGDVDVSALQPDARADIEAYRAALAEYGVTVVPGCIEAFVVLDEHKVAGTMDRVYRLADGRVVVGDLKTGSDVLSFAQGSIAVQLAAYSRGVRYDVGAGARVDTPVLDQQVGLVVHLPAGEARCELHLVDLGAGWEGFERSLWAREWRKRKTFAPLPKIAAPSAPASTTTGDADHSPATPTVQLDPLADSRARVEQRIASLSIAERRKLQEARAADGGWPKVADADAAALTVIEIVLDGIEAARYVPPTPAADAPPALPRRTPDEGAMLDDQTLTAVQAAYAALAPEGRTWIATLDGEAARQGVGFRLSGVTGRATVRRFEILRGLMALVAGDLLDDDYLRAVLHAVLRTDAVLFASVPAGAGLGVLDAAEAARFAELCATPHAVLIGDDQLMRLDIAA